MCTWETLKNTSTEILEWKHVQIIKPECILTFPLVGRGGDLTSVDKTVIVLTKKVEAAFHSMRGWELAFLAIASKDGLLFFISMWIEWTKTWICI